MKCQQYIDIESYTLQNYDKMSIMAVIHEMITYIWLKYNTKNRIVTTCQCQLIYEMAMEIVIHY